MNIVIIGSPKSNAEEIKTIAAKLTDAGMNVRYPTVEMLDIGETSAMVETFERIDWSDFVIAIPKEDLAFTHTTSAEISYAKHKKKAVFIYYG